VNRDEWNRVDERKGLAPESGKGDFKGFPGSLIENNCFLEIRKGKQ
jgi:hypothetical protein